MSDAFTTAARNLSDADREEVDSAIIRPSPNPPAPERTIRIVEVASQPSPAFATEQTTMTSEPVRDFATQRPSSSRIQDQLSAVRKPALIGAMIGLVVAIAAGTWLTRVISRTTPHPPATAANPLGNAPRQPIVAPTGLPAYAAPSAKVMARAQASPDASTGAQKPSSKLMPRAGTMAKNGPTVAPPPVAPTAAPAMREHTHPISVAAAQPDTGKSEWYASLKADLNSCNTDQSGFFARMVCKTRAQNRYCGGHWNVVPECPRAQDQSADH